MSIDICILWTTLCVGARMKRRRAQAGHNEASRSLTSDITQITQKTCPPSRRRSGKRDVTQNLSGQVHPNVADGWKTRPQGKDASTLPECDREATCKSYGTSSPHWQSVSESECTREGSDSCMVHGGRSVLPLSPHNTLSAVPARAVENWRSSSTYDADASVYAPLPGLPV